MNELTCHILETIYARMVHAKLDKMGTADKDVTMTTVTNIRGLTAVQSQVLSCVRTAIDDDGITVAQICEKLRGVPEKQIRQFPPLSQ